MYKQQILDKIEAAKKIAKLGYDEFLSFDSMSNFKVGNYYTLNSSGIVTKVIEKSDDYIKFETVMQESQRLEKHWHDCTEKITVDTGALACHVDTSYVLEPGESKTIPAFTEHGPYNADDGTTVLTVEFFKN